MAKDTDHLATSFETENTGGLLSGFLAEEDVFDRRALWRLGSWGVGSVGAVVLAVYANQSSMAMRRDQVAAADLARQAQQIQSVAKESQNETRRLASAIDTLNGDRDRLYSRVTVLEQGLDSVTGAIARQMSAAGPPPPASTPPASTPPASTAAATASDPPPAQKPTPAHSPTPAPAVSPVANDAEARDKPAEKPAPVAAAATEPAPPVASIAQKPPATPATPAAMATQAVAMTAPRLPRWGPRNR